MVRKRCFHVQQQQQQQHQNDSGKMTMSASNGLQHFTDVDGNCRSVNIWHDWLDTTSFHGVLDYRLEYGFAWKVAWVILIVLMAGLSVNNIREIINEYNDCPTVQEYFTESCGILLLPDVIVCGHRRFDPRKLREMGASENLIKALIPSGSSMLDEMFGTRYEIPQEEYRAFRQRNRNITYGELVGEAGFDCDSLIVANDIAANYCANSERVFSHAYGLCHRLLPYQVNQTWPGAGAGLKVILRKNELNSVKELIGGGLVDFVYPGQPMSFTFFSFPPNVVATVHIHEEKRVRINLPGRKPVCRKRNVNASVPIEALKTTTNGCYYATWAEIQYRFCGCTVVPQLGMPVCEPTDNCVNDPDTIKEYMIEVVRLQKLQCLPECERLRYNVQISYAPIDFGVLAADGIDLAPAGATVLDIYHPIMERTVIQEVHVYTTSTLVSNIGGALGLWLGASLVTFCQIVFYFCKWAIHVVHLRTLSKSVGDATISKIDYA